MNLTVASFPSHRSAERLTAFLSVEYGASLSSEIRLDVKTGRWIVYVNSRHKGWDTIRILSYGFMSGANV